MKHAARGSPNSTFDRCTRVALRAALAFAGLAFCAPATAAATDLTIRLCGMQNRDGALRITVFERAAAAEFTIADSKAWAADLTEKLEGHDWKPMSVTIPLPPGDDRVLRLFAQRPRPGFGRRVRRGVREARRRAADDRNPRRALEPRRRRFVALPEVGRWIGGSDERLCGAKRRSAFPNDIGSNPPSAH
jgi:hypothetical protein